MNRGYAGIYRGTYLRSSYEYAYAKYLDYIGVQWKYEERIFELGDRKYKPDFFIYDNQGNLDYIVEIKSRDKRAINNALLIGSKIEHKYKIICKVFSYKELLELYKSLPFSLTSTIDEWIKSTHTTISKSIAGNLNPHFNLKHNETTKRKIGQNTKRLWSTNSDAKLRMLEGLRKSGLVQKGKIKTPREKRACKHCDKIFQTLITSNQTYCTQRCAGKSNLLKATLKNNAAHIQAQMKVRDFIITWSMENKELVKNTPFNKIKTCLIPMLNDIQKRFGVKDFRTLSAAVFGEDRGRKELLKYMKKHHYLMKIYAELY